MTSKTVKFALVLAAVAFVASLTGYIFGARANNSSQEKNVESQTAVNSSYQSSKVAKKEEKPKDISQTYLLKSEGSGVSLYCRNSDGTQTLYKKYDIPVKFLPKSDREALKKGIEFNSIEDVLQLIEDYL